MWRRCLLGVQSAYFFVAESVCLKHLGPCLEGNGHSRRDTSKSNIMFVSRREGLQLRETAGYSYACAPMLRGGDQKSSL